MTALIADIVLPTGNILGTLVLILDIIAIVSVLLGRGSVGHKLLWTLLIILLPVVGMVLYYLIGRSPVDANLTR